MVKESIQRSLDLVRVEKELDGEAAKRHRGGLARILARLHEPTERESHISLSGSGSLELPREQGGKGKYMADFARTFATARIENNQEIDSIQGLYDCFGQMLITIDVADLAKRLLEAQKPLTWGDVVYVDFLSLSRRLFEGEQTVPLGLARILLLISSQDLKEYGSYNRPEVGNLLNMPLFREKGISEFQPRISAIPVKAALSIESAGKCRLVTSNPAAYTQIGQCINHFMRTWLSKDPFCRIGFEEADKLWEVLSSYKKFYESGRFGASPDSDD